MRLPTATLSAVVALGVTQIIAWAATVYALGVLARAISNDMGWSGPLVFGGLTCALLASGLVSTHAGRAIDRYGARTVMSIGYVFLSALLVLLSLVTSPLTYLMTWATLGVAMRLTLYDAAFAALVQIDPANGRRAISYLTLFGGFASTVGWPAAHYLEAATDWRVTFQIFAAANAMICLPLVWFVLPHRASSVTPPNAEPKLSAPTKSVTAQPPAPSAAIALEGRDRTIALGLFALAVSGSACAFGVGAVHLVALLEAEGLAVATAVALSALKGVAQVAGRVWDIAVAKWVSVMTVGRIALALLPVSFAILLAFQGSYAAALAFTLAFGISNGLVTNVRGALPLALFGPVGYGRVLGLLATPYLLLNALAPLVFALLVEAAGYDIATGALLAVVALGALAMEVLATWHRKRVKAAR
ncbi:MAG: MFS transporter [Hyphomicrobiaceae bacterium]